MKSTGTSHAIDINEILVGFYIAEGDWSLFGDDVDVVKNKVAEKHNHVNDQEFIIQSGRAAKAADEVMSWAREHGYTAPVERLWWTARKGSLKNIVPNPTKGNPSDIVIRFADGKVLGVSIKSTNDVEPAFKNPGIGTIEKLLNVHLTEFAETGINYAKTELGLNGTHDTRKTALRDDDFRREKSVAMGSAILEVIRDTLCIRMMCMTQKELADHFANEWLCAVEPSPRYVKVVVSGKPGEYRATVTDPTVDTRLLDLYKGPVRLRRLGDTGIGVEANGARIMRIRAKYASEKLASSVKLIGEPWQEVPTNGS